MLKRVQKLFRGLSKPKEKPSLATITIHPMEEKDTDTVDTSPPLSRTPSPAEQALEEIDEEFKSMGRELDSISQNLSDVMSELQQPKQEEQAPPPEKSPFSLDSAIFHFDTSSSDSDASMTDSVFTADTAANQALLEEQANCIQINNEGLQSQYEQMQQNQAYLQQQEYIHNCNQTLANQLKEEIQDAYDKLYQIQQQVYYHRRELDQLAEQTLSYEGVIQQHQKTIRDQEDQIDRNHKLLAYDKQMVGSLSYVFQAQPYANQIATLAAMSTFEKSAQNTNYNTE